MTGFERLKAFAKSPHHAWLALLTLGGGLATAAIPGIIAGVAAYALAWIYLPDSKFFRSWLEKRKTAAVSADKAQTQSAFLRQRAELYGQLSPEGRKAYDDMAQSAYDLKESFTSSHGALPHHHDARLGKLVWTYLRLLHTGESLSQFLKAEPADDLKRQMEELQGETAQLKANIEKLESSGDALEVINVQRLLESKSSRLETLQQRLERIRQAESDLHFTRAEQERLKDSVRLIRADLVASRDPGTLAREIDSATARFNHTQDFLRDLEFDHTPSDIPEEITGTAPLRVTE